MSHQENRISDSHFSKWVEGSAPPEDALETARLSATRTLAMDEAGAAIARQLNGPLTALLLYMGEIKQHSHQFSQSAGERVYLQQVVENALQQTERVCAMMKQLAENHDGSAAAPSRKGVYKSRPSRRWCSHAGRHVCIEFRPEAVDEARARGPEPHQRRVLQ